MSNFVLNAEARTDAGKGASRRLRHQARVPAVIYGNNVAPASVSLELRELVKRLEDDVFYASVIDLNIDGKKEQVVLRDLQRHPAKGIPMHADFQRVDAKQKINLNIPLHFINEEKCVGVKQDGGEIQRNLAEVEVSSLPKDLPDFIEVDMAEVALGEIVHLADLKLPQGVELIQLQQGHNLPVAAVHAKKVSVEEEESGDASDAEAAE